jgi:hypothetical protein
MPYFNWIMTIWGMKCLDPKSDSQNSNFCRPPYPLNALKESSHSAHSVLAPLRARLRGLKGCVYFQWVPAHCGLLGNERADEEARKAAELGPADGAQRGRISFEVVKGLIRSQAKDAPPNHAHTLWVFGDGIFRCLQGA